MLDEQSAGTTGENDESTGAQGVAEAQPGAAEPGPESPEASPHGDPLLPPQETEPDHTEPDVVPDPAAESSPPPSPPTDPPSQVSPEAPGEPPADPPTEPPADTQADRAEGEDAPVAKKATARTTARKTAAKKTTTPRKTAARKTAAKKTAAAAPAADPSAAAVGAAEVPADGASGPSDSPADAATPPETGSAPPARKRATRRPAKKAALTTPSVPDEPAEVVVAPEDASAVTSEQTSTSAPASPPPVLFVAPVATERPARRRSTRARATTPEPGVAEDAAAAADHTLSDAPPAEPGSAPEGVVPDADTGRETDSEGSDADEAGQDETGPRRRRRRGGRRRRRGGPDDGDSVSEAGREDESDDEPTAAAASREADRDSAEGRRAGAVESGPDENGTGKGAESAPDSEDENGSETGEAGSSRRRRRRRRSGEAEGDQPAEERPSTPRARKSRSPEDEITGFSGSTRLEAKKQRRREGREAGRRRAPIISEAEFLARREAVDRVMVIRQRGDLTQIAVLEDKVLVEHYVARESQASLIGNVYLGRVQNVLPSMEAAFIDIGKGRNAVLYAGEVNWEAMGGKDGPRRIEAVLKSGQSVMVQVSKDPVGHKGARLTSQISLAGRFLVLVPDGTTNGISRKLPDTERNRLKTVLREIVPETAGVIVRTAAEGASEDELTKDVERLAARWDEISAKAGGGQGPTLLYGEPDLTLKVVRDLFTEDFGSLVVDGGDAWETVSQYVEHVAPDLADRLERFEAGAGGQDAFAAYRVDEQIAKGLDRKVWLPSGGSLVIDRTEAMTVIDVNTGKFTGSGGNLEETVTKNNLEAAEEIVRQLRLRDIGGIIVVDFIDMVLEGNRDLVLRRLVECLGRDRTRHQVAEVTSLGLVQMTRKRIGTGLLEAFSEPCQQCLGRGVVISHEPVEPADQSEEEEPRRGRRARTGRERGSNGGDRPGRAERPTSQGNGSRVPTPADLAAMARHEEHSAEPVPDEADRTSSPGPDAVPAGTDVEQVTGSVETVAALSPVEVPVVPPVAPAVVPAVVAAPAEDAPMASAPEESDGAQETSGRTEPVAQEPSAPQTRIVTRVRRRGAQRPAGPPKAAAVGLAVAVMDAPGAQTDGSGGGEESRHGDPDGDPASDVANTASVDPAVDPAEEPGVDHGDDQADDPGELEGGSAAGTPDPEDEHAWAHVPVKRKGSRKR